MTRTILHRAGLVICFAAIASLAATRSSGGIKVAAWIDPGHGANDDYYGAPCFNDDEFPDEKDLNLQVAQRVQTRLAPARLHIFLRSQTPPGARSCSQVMC